MKNTAKRAKELYDKSIYSNLKKPLTCGDTIIKQFCPTELGLTGEFNCFAEGGGRMLDLCHNCWHLSVKKEEVYEDSKL